MDHFVHRKTNLGEGWEKDIFLSMCSQFINLPINNLISINQSLLQQNCKLYKTSHWQVSIVQPNVFH